MAFQKHQLRGQKRWSSTEHAPQKPTASGLSRVERPKDKTCAPGPMSSESFHGERGPRPSSWASRPVFGGCAWGKVKRGTSFWSFRHIAQDPLKGKLLKQEEQGHWRSGYLGRFSKWWTSFGWSKGAKRKPTLWRHPYLTPVRWGNHPKRVKDLHGLLFLPPLSPIQKIEEGLRT